HSRSGVAVHKASSNVLKRTLSYSLPIISASFSSNIYREYWGI
ncbi:unnamed protein product, partial [Rotaria magnacalcarata]